MSSPAQKLAKVHTSPSGRRYVDIEEIIEDMIDESVGQPAQDLTQVGQPDHQQPRNGSEPAQGAGSSQSQTNDSHTE